MATLKTTMLEEITLQGDKHRVLTTKSYTGINELSRRIVTITTAEAVIATFSAAVASAGHYVAADVRYIRFTNLDSTNFITLTFRNQDNDEFAVKVDAGCSLSIFGDVIDTGTSGGLMSMFDANTSALTVALDNLASITAEANTSACDMEIYIALI